MPWSRHTKRLKPADDFTIQETFEIVKHDVSNDTRSNNRFQIVVPCCDNISRPTATARIHN